VRKGVKLRWIGLYILSTCVLFLRN